MENHNHHPKTSPEDTLEGTQTVAGNQKPATTHSDGGEGLPAIVARRGYTLLTGQFDWEQLGIQRTFQLRHRQQVRGRRPLDQARDRRDLQPRPAGHLPEGQPLNSGSQPAGELSEQLPTGVIHTNTSTHPTTTNR